MPAWVVIVKGWLFDLHPVAVALDFFHFLIIFNLIFKENALINKPLGQTYIRWARTDPPKGAFLAVGHENFLNLQKN